MPVSGRFRHSFELAHGCLEASGCWLLTLYQVAVAASHGRLPYREFSPRLAGALASLTVSLTLIVTLLIVLRSTVRAPETPPSATVAQQASEPAFIIRCERCNWQRTLTQSELGGVRSCNGVYYCEKCRAYTAYREHLGNNCVVTPPPAGGYPCTPPAAASRSP